MSDEITQGRIEDMLDRAERGIPAVSAFLSPAAQVLSKSILNSLGCVSYRFFGGYTDAERNRLFVIPEYYVPEDLFPEYIVPLKICGSGYYTLSHGDYLGALTGLKLKREVIGDILLCDAHSAIVFFDTKIAAWLTGSETPIKKIGADTVHVFQIDISGLVIPTREFETVSDTVASDRLDCVVGALCNFAREKAKSVITSGDVSLNYIEEKRPDREVRDGDTVTIRHIGKFRIDSVSQSTRRGRIRLSASKYK